MREWKTLKVAQTERYITTVTMNRPERRNAISMEMAREMEACFTELKANAGIRAIILTGEGSAFGSGADLKERAGFNPENTRLQRETVLRIVELMETCPAPVIGMINGPAIAGGFELALGCDIRIASEKATFSLTEVRNVGSFPGAGGPVRLPKLIGKGRASYVVLTARLFPADEAFRLGFVELVVPHAELRDQTLTIAREIAGNSPMGVSAAKKLIRQSNDLDVYSATELSRALRDPLDKSGDYAEGLKAWLESRTPEFTGR
jgi:enoyl-CoA hydratase